jgi:hypothetical protein
VTDLRTLADQMVIDPPAGPPELWSLVCRRNRRRHRVAALGSAVVVLVAAAAAIALVGDDDSQKVVTGTTTTSSTIPTVVDPPLPMGTVDLEFEVEPTHAGRSQVSVVNHTDKPAQVGCQIPRLDRWTGEAWSPMGLGFTGEHGWDEPTLSCLSRVVLQPGASEPIARVDLSPLEPGWYRWVDDGERDGRSEGRFTVGEEPRGTPDRATTWFPLGDDLFDVLPLPQALQAGRVDAFTVNGSRLVFTWTTHCNVPLAAVTMSVSADRLTVEPLFTSYFITDCVGIDERAGPWVAAVDIPPSLRRHTVVLEDGRGRTTEPVPERQLAGTEVLARGSADAHVPVAIRPGGTVESGRLSLFWIADSCHNADARVDLLLLGDLAVPLVRVPEQCSHLGGDGPAGSSFPLSDRAAALPLINQN